MVNLLFMSVGRRVELMRAFRASYKTLGISGRIIGVDVDALAPALEFVDEVYLVPRLSSPDIIPRLKQICSRERISVVLPLIDPDIPLLARSRDILESTGARVEVVSEEALEIVSDKFRTLEFFQDLGLAVPASWHPEELEDEQPLFPLFIKPRQGSAAKYAFPVQDQRELDFFRHYVPDPIVQELLPGPEITNDVICDADGRVLSVVSRQRIEVRSGEAHKAVTIHNPEILDAAVKVAEALPAVGTITLQCIMKEGRPYFTEINARMGGGLPLAIAAGADVPGWLLSRAANRRYDVPPLGSFQTGLYMTRYDDSHFITEGELGQIGSDHL